MLDKSISKSYNIAEEILALAKNIKDQLYGSSDSKEGNTSPRAPICTMFERSVQTGKSLEDLYVVLCDIRDHLFCSQETEPVAPPIIGKKW